tara:strand:- start:338 stop:661 length:324 start_codon:yes stop_codon:yes gene_type:complete
MRQIERNMNRAIRNGANFSSSNTSVVSEDGVSIVRLHGNHIATINKATDSVVLFDGGWQSNTTKSRINALCDEFAYGCRVFQKQFEWFVSTRSGTVDFDNGITLKFD